MNCLFVFGKGEELEQVNFLFDKINKNKCLLLSDCPNVYIDESVKRELEADLEDATTKTSIIFRKFLTCLISQNEQLNFKDTKSVSKKFRNEITAARKFILLKRNDFPERISNDTFRYWVNDVKNPTSKKPKVKKRKLVEDEGELLFFNFVL